MNVDNNEDDIIDRDEFFEVEAAMEEEEDDDDDDELHEDLQTRAERYDTDFLRPLTRRISANMEARVSLSVHECLPMVVLPVARQDFISAIAHGSNTIKAVTVSTIYGGEELFDDDIDINDGLTLADYITCFSELGQAFSTCEHLEKWEFHASLCSGAAVELLTCMTNSVEPFHKLGLVLVLARSLREPVGYHHLTRIRTLPNLERLELMCSSPDHVRRVCHEMTNCLTLRSLLLDGTVEWYSPIALTDDVVRELSALVRTNRLTSLELRCLNFQDGTAIQILLESIVATNVLREVRLVCLSIGVVGRVLYDSFGRSLFRLENLEKLAIFAGYDRPVDFNHEWEVEEACQLALLRSVRFLPKLVELHLPNCTWTQPLMQALVDYLTTNTTIQQLTLRATGRSQSPSVFSIFASVLPLCSLSELDCRLEKADDLITVATGIAMSSTIHRLTLSCRGMTIDTLSRLFHVLRLSQSLKVLHCDDMAFHSDHEALTKEVDDSPESMRRLCAAILENFSLEDIHLGDLMLCGRRSVGDWHLSHLINVVTRLNKEGRRYVKHMDDPSLKETTFRFLQAVNGSIDCLYLHLHDVPFLFDR